MSLIQEIWKTVPDNCNWRVSNLGGIERNKSGQWLPAKACRHKHGHLAVRIDKRTRYVHRLVLEAFVGPCPPGMECRHLDGNAGNNRLANLCWGTAVENGEDKVRHGTMLRSRRGVIETEILTDNFIPIEALCSDEVWKPIPGFPNYEASNMGGIRTYWKRGSVSKTLREKPVAKKPSANKHRGGYLFVVMRSESGRAKPVAVHLAIMMAFSPKPEGDLLCRHLDNDNQNNRLANLRWGTRKENTLDAIMSNSLPVGSMQWKAKLDEGKAAEIKLRLDRGERGADLAREFGVSASVVCEIRGGRRWKHAIAKAVS